MSKPSPYSHLIRLAGILIVAGVGFAFVRQQMIPDTWNWEGSYRESALADVAAKPMTYGGNHSCASCHEDSDGTHDSVIEELSTGAHKGLSCEACHGPLGEHVRDNKKIADARVEYSGLVCLHCHSNLISRPPQHPKFILKDEILPDWREKELLEAAKERGQSRIYRHNRKVHAHMDCVNCHISFHDPET